MNRKRKPKKALPTILIYLSLGIVLLWVVCMTAITLLESEHLSVDTQALARNYLDLDSSHYGWSGDSSYSVRKDTDPFLFSKIINEIYDNHLESGEYGRDFPFQPALLVLRDDELVTCSGDYAHGPLEAKKDSPYLKTALERDYFLTYDNGNTMFPNASYRISWPKLRFTGHWDADSFQTLIIECFDEDDGWRPLYAVPGADTTGAEVIALEKYHLGAYSFGQSITRDGVTYPSLLDYLLALYKSGDFYDYWEENTLWDTVEIVPFKITAVDGNDYVFWTAIRTHPLPTAVAKLKWVYLVTAAPAVLLIVILWRTMRKRLIVPIQEVHHRMKEGWNLPPFDPQNEPWFSEATLLAEQYNAHQYDLYHRDKEITRLNAALNYAHEAEENRRQLTSSIAHELKTPLAIIHGYSEGLQERINEEKRDQYLNIILSECERMDGMVLEMLDLSRLEAGKVKLAQDTFSLADLARGVFERLELALLAKELTVEYDVIDDDTITADEGRIGQVITNFATNALKYTKPGGTIWVRTDRPAGHLRFEVENTCDPLPRAALDRVWDSFYRADSARSGEGTGLGLAICKRIIELHGGKVSARNTENGVAFRFLI